MVEIKINKTDVDFAKNKLQNIKFKDNVKSSKFGYEKNRILNGYIGERVIMNFLNIKTDTDNYDYDLISNKGKKIEVKTINCKFKPLPSYLCTVNSHSLERVHKQKADYYVFVRILNDYSKAWVLGWICCKDFFYKGRFVPKNTNFGKFKFVTSNATVLEINKLNKFKL